MSITPRGEQKAVVYLRNSRREIQRMRCMEVAERLGLTIVREYADIGGTPPSGERVGLRRLLIETPGLPRINYVIVSDAARISRNMEEFFAIDARLRRLGIELLIADTDCQFFSGPQAREVEVSE